MARWLLLLTFLGLSVQAAPQQAIALQVLEALQTAQTAQQRGDYQAARRALDKASAARGSLEEALLWRSKAYLAWAEGDSAKALRLLEKVYASGQLDEAAKENERLNLARLNLAEARYGRVVELLAPLPAAADEEQLKMLVQAYQGLGRHAQALPLAERYVKANPQADDLWLQLLVGGNARLERYTEAQRWQQRLLARHPDQPRLWWQLAGLQQMANREGHALATLRTAHAKGVTFTEGELDNLVLLAAAADQPWQGARLLEGLLENGLLARSPARLERLGRLWWQARERASAAEVYRQLARRSGAAGHWMNLAQLELEQSRWQAGLDALRMAEKAGADRRTVRDWREWAKSEMALASPERLAQAH